MAAGKNKLERSFRFLVNTVDLTGDLLPGTVQGGGLVFDEVEMTGVSNSVKNYLAGHAESVITAQFHMNDTASTGAYTVLNALQGTADIALALQYGAGGAAPTTGDPEWAGDYTLLDCSAAPNGGKWVLNTTWKPSPGSTPAWGTV